MKIEDDEMRAIFEAESGEALEKLETGLLALERDPHDRERLTQVFRVVHSLKGAAGMLGVDSVEMLAHQLEDMLEASRSGSAGEARGAGTDQLYQALDALRMLVREAVTGEPSGLDLRLLLQALREKPDAPAAPPEKPAEPPLPPPLPRPAGVGGTTLRVQVGRLDEVLDRVGDLVVTTARVGLRLSEVEGLRDLHEQWLREWRGALDGAGRWQQEGHWLGRLGECLEQLARRLEDDQARLSGLTDHLRNGIQDMRLLPLSTLLHPFPRLVRDLSLQEGKEISLVLEGAETTADRRILEGLKDPLVHLLRNAVDHGVEKPALREVAGKPRQATIRVAARRQGGELHLEVSDDGLGVDLVAIRQRALERQVRTFEQLATATEAEIASLIFAPDFSTRSVVSDLSGRGTGLDVVRSGVEALNGSVDLEWKRGQGTTFRLRLPLTLATTTAMVCQEGGQLYGLPLNWVDRTLDLGGRSVRPVQGRPTLEVEGTFVPLASLGRLLGAPEEESGSMCVVLRDQEERLGCLVTGLTGVLELVVKPLQDSRLVLGASILADGSIAQVLNPAELFRRARSTPASPTCEAPALRQQRILLAEDSASVRQFLGRLLEDNGYAVTACQDGQEAWERLQNEPFDAVVSDLEMPGLDGLQLTRRLRASRPHLQLPVVLISSREEEATRQAGLDSGATAFLGKSELSEETLTELLERLL